MPVRFTVVISVLNDQTLAAAIAELAKRDPHLAAVVARHGAPPLWERPPGLATLVQIILEQQVSVASAAATFERLIAASGGGSAERLATLDDSAYRAVGVSRQKARYIRLLAQAVVDGSFDPAALAAMDDDAARAALMRLTGIGRWTADIYLLMALSRADVWPSGDLAVVIAARELKRLRAQPNPRRLERLGEAWRPWRAVATRILWQHYLNTPRLRANGANGARSPRSGMARPSPHPDRTGRRSGTRSGSRSRANAGAATPRPSARMPRRARTRG